MGENLLRYYKKGLLLTLSFLTSITLTSFGQTKNYQFTNQQWVQYYNQLTLSKRWALLSDGGFRWKYDLGQKSQYIARTGMGYQVNPGIRVTVGFAHLGFYTSGAVSKAEYRPYQELLIKENHKKIRMEHRFRVEERFFRVIGLGTSTFNFRFRYRLLLSTPVLPLFVSSGNKVKLKFGDEIFINAGKDVVYNIFDQNRILIGPIVPLNKNLSVSVIYTYQFAAKNVPKKYEQDQVIWLGVKQTIDLTGSR